MTLKELLEKRAKLAAEIRKLADTANDENRDFTAEEQGQWETVNNEYNELSRNIERAQRAAEVVTEMESSSNDFRGATDVQRSANDQPRNAEQAATEEDRSNALQAWLRVRAGMDLEERHIQSCQRLGFRTEMPSFRFDLVANYSDVRREFRAVGDNPQTVTTTGGGYLIPEGFVRNFEIALLAFGGVRQVADVMRTADGGNLPWPTANDTNNTGELLGINTAADEQEIAVGRVVFGAYKFSSKAVTVPNELLEDSAFNLATELGKMLGERIARVQNTYFTNGTGTNQPSGIVTGASLGKTAASASAMTADEVLDLIHSVDPAYRTGARFMMHDSITLLLRKLKDSVGQYIWQPGMVNGLPDTLFNYPLTINQDMANVLEASAKPLLFGQMSKYKIRDINSMRIKQSNDLKMIEDQVVFVAFARGDGGMLDAGTHPVRYMQMAGG